MNWFSRLLSALFGSSSSTPSTPPPPATPAPVIVDVAVWGTDGILSDAKVSLVPYEHAGQIFDSIQCPDGYQRRVVLPAGTTIGWGGDVIVSHPGYETKVKGVVLEPNLNISLDPEVLLPRLVANGEFFTTADGIPVTIIEATDFKLFKKYLDNEDITPVLSQRQSIGFNCVRVLGMARNMWDFNPAAYGDRYYGSLINFFDLCARYGLYVEFTAFADTKMIMPDPDAQLNHWQRVCAAAETVSNVLLELVNENDQHENGVFDTNKFSEAAIGVLCSHGSNGSGAEPVRPEWDYETFHYNDASEWQRKTAHNPMEDGYWQVRRPSMANENTRFPDKCDRSELAYDAARGAALLTAGSCFHSVRGKSSELWDGLELECAFAWANGAKSVDLSQRTFPYINRTDTSNKALLRTYQRGSEIVTIRR